MPRSRNISSGGFTILELMIGMAIFLVISGVVLTAMGQYQANYRKIEISTQMQQQLRSTMDLMAQEIGQAGLQASTVEGANTFGNATITAPYTITPQITSAMTNVANQQVAFTSNAATTLEQPYYGQWLLVADGANSEAIQVTGISSGNILTEFGSTHPASTPVYPMGVFPHGVLSDQSSATKLAMFGEINGSGNGLWAVEYTCPTAAPWQLTRTQWNLSQSPISGTSYTLINDIQPSSVDGSGVTHYSCYFCWPGSSYVDCPSGMASPDNVTLALDPVIACPATGTNPTQPTAGSGYCTYPMITQVGFTITASEPVTIFGSTQNVTVTKSYSNIQPRNLIAADNIYKSACSSALAAGNTSCTVAGAPYTTYATYLNGELQPDPPALASVPW